MASAERVLLSLAMWASKAIEGVGRQRPGHRPLERVGMRKALQPFAPRPAVPFAAPADRAPSVHDAVGDDEGRVRPAELLARSSDFLGSERLAVSVVVAFQGGGALADPGLAGDQRRPVLPRRPAQRPVDLGHVVAIDPPRGPAGGAEAGELVAAFRQGGGPVDGDVVVVPKHGQPSEGQPAGERDRLLADPLHQVAVAADHPGAVVHQPVAEAGVESPLRHSHAHGGGETLAEGAGGGLHAGRVAELGMARRDRAPLAEGSQRLERHALVAGQTQHRILQHRAVSVGQHEAVPIRPGRVGGVELQVSGEQHGGDVGHAHGHAGMAAASGLHRVHGQHPDGVGHDVRRHRKRGGGEGLGHVAFVRRAAGVCGSAPPGASHGGFGPAQPRPMM